MNLQTFGIILINLRKVPHQSRQIQPETGRPMAVKRKPKYEWNADNIRALRHHLDMSQQQMSEELGIRQQTVSDWELGYHRPRGGMARLLTLVAERADFTYRTNPPGKSDKA